MADTMGAAARDRVASAGGGAKPDLAALGLRAPSAAGEPAPPTLADAEPAAAAAPPPTNAEPARRGGRWFAAVCAAVALAGAAVSLSGPALRPVLLAQSDSWLSGDRRLADLLAPKTDVDRAVEALLPRVDAIEAELPKLRAELRKLDVALGQAAAEMHEGMGSVEALAERTEAARRRIDALEARGQDLAARARAAGLLTLSAQLRRELEAGQPMAGSLALLDAAAPFPSDAARAVEALRPHADGVDSMRDLARGYEAVDAGIAAMLGRDESGWGRLRALFGGADARAALADRARAMAEDGRFLEAAAMLDAPPFQAVAKDWIARVRARAEAARAARTIAEHAAAEALAAKALAR